MEARVLSQPKHVISRPNNSIEDIRKQLSLFRYEIEAQAADIYEAQVIANEMKAQIDNVQKQIARLEKWHPFKRSTRKGR